MSPTRSTLSLVNAQMCSTFFGRAEADGRPTKAYGPIEEGPEDSKPKLFSFLGVGAVIILITEKDGKI